MYWYGLPKNITATGLIYTGPGTVAGVIVNSHTSGTIKLWDAITATTPVIVDTFTFPTGSGSYPFFGAKFNVGLFATIGGTANVTLIINPFNG